MLSSVNKETGELSQVAGRQATADKIFYDNSETGIPASNVQEAIDKSARIFYGTRAEWNELTTEEKVVYEYAAFSEGSEADKYIFISDSYGQHPTVATAWDAKVIEKLGLTSSYYFRWTEGSMGFRHKGSSGHTFQELAEAHESDVSDPSSVKAIILGSGVNDAYYATESPGYTIDQLKESILACLNYLKATYPNATIYLGCYGNWIEKSQSAARILVQLPRVFSESVSLIGGKYITGIENIMHFYPAFDDSQHPSEWGSNELAKCVVACLNGTEYHFSGACSTHLDADTTVMDTFRMSGIVSITDNLATLTFDSSQIVFKTPTSGSFTEMAIGTYNARELGSPINDWIGQIQVTMAEGFSTFVPVGISWKAPTIHSPSGSECRGTVYLHNRASGQAFSSGGITGFTLTIPTIYL